MSHVTPRLFFASRVCYTLHCIDVDVDATVSRRGSAPVHERIAIMPNFILACVQE